MTQEESPHQTPNLLYLNCELPSLQNCEKFLVYQPPSLWYFVIAAQMDQDKCPSWKMEGWHVTMSATYFQMVKRGEKKTKSKCGKMLSVGYY
jgi:hypothetical protein